MKLKITVHGVAYEVDVEVLDAGKGFPSNLNNLAHTAKSQRIKSDGPAAQSHAADSNAGKPAAAESGGSSSVASPIAGTIIEIKCNPGDEVDKGKILLVIEAMKMKTSIAAPVSGKIKKIPVAVGDSVHENQILIEFE